MVVVEGEREGYINGPSHGRTEQTVYNSTAGGRLLRMTGTRLPYGEGHLLDMGNGAHDRIRAQWWRLLLTQCIAPPL